MLTDHKYASLVTCIEYALLGIVFLWIMSTPVSAAVATNVTTIQTANDDDAHAHSA